MMMRKNLSPNKNPKEKKGSFPIGPKINQDSRPPFNESPSMNPRPSAPFELNAEMPSNQASLNTKLVNDLQKSNKALEAHLKEKDSEIERLKQLLREREVKYLNNLSMTLDDPNDEYGKYHGVISIDRFRDIKDVNKGWIIEFPTHNELSKDIFETVGRSNAFLTVTGAYDKGKTFLLNKICNSRFPSGKKVETKGISFKKTYIKGTEVTIIDSAGSHSPIKISETIEEKRETEKRLRDIIFLLSDFFILVVNDYTTLDQEILEKLEKQLQGNKSKKNKEIIIVHNLKDIYNDDDQRFIWVKQIEGLYIEENKNNPSSRQECASRQECEIEGRTIYYLKTEFCRHVMLVNDNTEYGKDFNNLVVKMITMWIQTSCVNYSKRNFFDNFFDILSQNLNSSDKNSRENSVTEDDSIFFEDKGLLVTRIPNKNSLKLVCNDSVVNDISVLPDFYEPALDIVETDDSYIILIDVPGIEPFDTAIDENQIKFTLTRKRQYETGYKVSERAFGECTKAFKIPPKYSDDPDINVDKGVLRICFKKKEVKKKSIKF